MLDGTDYRSRECPQKERTCCDGVSHIGHPCYDKTNGATHDMMRSGLVIRGRGVGGTGREHGGHGKRGEGVEEQGHAEIPWRR